MKPLSTVQKRVLAELTWDARAPIEQIARRLKVRTHTVRHAYRTLHDMLDLKPVCWTNSFILGQIPFRIYLSVHCSDTSRVHQFIKYLLALTEVYFLAALIGQFQFVMTIRAANLEELTNIIRKIDKNYGDIIVGKNISVIADVICFTPWLAHTTSSRRRMLSFQSASPSIAVDELDLKILEAVRQRPLASVTELSASAGAPTSTTAYRFERLLKTGAIIGFGFAFDDLRVGNHAFIMTVSTRGLSSGLFDTFVEFARAHPLISWLTRSFGERDIELGVAVGELSELNTLTQEIINLGHQSIREVVIHTYQEGIKG